MSVILTERTSRQWHVERPSVAVYGTISCPTRPERDHKTSFRDLPRIIIAGPRGADDRKYSIIRNSCERHIFRSRLNRGQVSQEIINGFRATQLWREISNIFPLGL